MTTGTLSSGVCFASQAAAARNECSVMARAGNQGMTCSAVAAGPSETAGGAVTPTFTQRWQASGSTTFTTVTVALPLQPCEMEDYWPWALSVADGALIAGAVASVWIGGAVWRWLQRVVSE